MDDLNIKRIQIEIGIAIEIEDSWPWDTKSSKFTAWPLATWQGYLVQEESADYRIDFDFDSDFDPEETNSQQPGAGQPATRPVFEPEGGDKPEPDAEGRTR